MYLVHISVSTQKQTTSKFKNDPIDLIQAIIKYQGLTSTTGILKSCYMLPKLTLIVWKSWKAPPSQI